MTVKISEIRYLVLQGGSVRGIAYLGALEQLVHEGLIINNLKAIAGTSAGAIVAFLLTLGFSLPELCYELSNMNFTDFLDESGCATKDVLLNAVGNRNQSGSATSQFFGQSVSHPSTTSTVASRLSQGFGVYDGEFFRKWIEGRSFLKTSKENLTFLELHQLAIEQPTKYKDLFVVGANLSTSSSQIFSYQHTPNAIISDAVRISMSIPLVFKPHCSYIKNECHERVAHPDAHLYVDGGLLDNYPIQLFDSSLFLPDSARSETTNSLFNSFVLGLRLVSKEKIDYFTGKALAPMREISDFMGYFKALLCTIKNKQESDHKLTECDRERSIYIDTVGVDMLDFNASKEEKTRLVESGKCGVQDYCSAHPGFTERLTESGSADTAHEQLINSASGLSFEVCK